MLAAGFVDANGNPAIPSLGSHVRTIVLAAGLAVLTGSGAYWLLI